MKRRQHLGLAFVLLVVPACAAVIGIKDLIPGDESNNPDGGPGSQDAPPGQGNDQFTNNDGPITPGDEDGGDGGLFACDADINASALHCGRCGHSCLGGGCEGGLCQPVAIAQGLGTVGGVVINDTHVYFTTLPGDNKIQRVAKTGGTVDTLASGASVRQAKHLAINATHVYWANAELFGGAINRCPLAGCGAATPETISNPEEATGVALDATHVYWSDGNGQVIERRLLSGGAVQRVAVPQGARPMSVVTSNGIAWWVGDFSGQVQRSNNPPDGGIAINGANGQSGREITVDPTHVYWTAQVDPGELGKISRAPRNQTGGVQELAVAGGEPLGIYVDGQTVYWTAQAPDGGTGGGVYSAPIAGGQRATLVGLQNLPRGIATDTGAIYWGVSGRIMKLAKP
jgi:hypothetical protein